MRRLTLLLAVLLLIGFVMPVLGAQADGDTQPVDDEESPGPIDAPIEVQPTQIPPALPIATQVPPTAQPRPVNETSPAPTAGPTPRPTPTPGDPAGSLLGQNTTVCEGDLRLELAIEDAFVASDGTVWVVVRTRNTGRTAGNLSLKVRLHDDRGRSFNMVNPRDPYILGPVYNEAVSYVRSRGFNVRPADEIVRPGMSALILLAFLANSDASAYRLVPDSPCG